MENSANPWDNYPGTVPPQGDFVVCDKFDQKGIIARIDDELAAL